MDPNDPLASSNRPEDGVFTVSVLASGSRGNATYVSDGHTAILLDAGLSGVEIQRRMDAKGLDPALLQAILVSHEHADHIHGVGVLSRRFGLTVHISDATYKASKKGLGRLAGVRPFVCGEAFSIGTLAIHPFSISHDAIDPAGFTISGGRCKVGFATDLGVVTGLVREHLQACNILVLEANHDPEMLVDGPYPWPLKQRIRGRSGHLSNDDTASLLENLLHDKLRHVVLAHLSEENNTPEMARQIIDPLLDGNGVRLHVATQAEGCAVLTFIA